MDDHRILEYLDGTLGGDETRQFEAWLQSDPAARALVEQHRKAWELLAELDPGVAACPDFRRETALKARQHATPRRTAWLLRSVALLAATLLVVLGLWKSGPGSIPEEVDRALLEHIELLEQMDFLEEYGESLDLFDEVEQLLAFEGEIQGEVR